MKELISKLIREAVETPEIINKILDKINDSGMDSLTPEEKKLLDKASKGDVISGGNVKGKKFVSENGNFEFEVERAEEVPMESEIYGKNTYLGAEAKIWGWLTLKNGGTYHGHIIYEKVKHGIEETTYFIYDSDEDEAEIVKEMKSGTEEEVYNMFDEIVETFETEYFN